MKTKPKRTGKTSKQPVSKRRKQVKLILGKHPAVRHFRLIEHRHSFKLIHHRHTSHMVLFLVLILTGFFMFASDRMVSAETTSGNVVIGTIVPGPPPTIGATINTPNDGTTIKDKKIIDVSGTCYENSFVIVKSNDSIVGSTACSGEGIFSLQVQLGVGKNILTALNYDNLNQAGPATPSVTVYITETKTKPTPAPTTPSEPSSPSIDVSPIQKLTPVLPDNPSIITGVNSSFQSCNDYRPDKLTAGGELRVAIVCVPRLFMPDVQQVMGLLVWGGTPPYALSVNFGSETDENQESTLLSLASPGYAKIKFSYAVPDIYRIKFRLTDKKNETAIVETAVQVNGEQKTTASSIVNDISKTLFGNDSWFESPVPFYLLAVAITLGFWGGDIFDRKFGAGKYKTRRRIAA